MAPVRRKSKGGGGEEEAGGCTGEGEDEGRRRWQPALGRRQKGAFLYWEPARIMFGGLFSVFLAQVFLAFRPSFSSIRPKFSYE
jgi:hypothetical protein